MFLTAQILLDAALEGIDIFKNGFFQVDLGGVTRRNQVHIFYRSKTMLGGWKKFESEKAHANAFIRFFVK